MTRPERKLKSLKDKIDEKTARLKQRAPGKRLKRWKKAAEKFQPAAG